jgi:hypothetical protein
LLSRVLAALLLAIIGWAGGSTAAATTAEVRAVEIVGTAFRITLATAAF